jgi:hypothetical protein
MNHEIQLFKTFVTVENPSITVDHAVSETTAAACCFSPFRRHRQPTRGVHKTATTDSQVFHGLKPLLLCSQPAVHTLVRPPVVHSIDSLAARFSTTAKFIKL